MSNKALKTVKDPFNFSQPPYDARSSSFVNAGTEYGSGKVQKVGHSGDPKAQVNCIPKGCYAVTPAYPDPLLPRC